MEERTATATTTSCGRWLVAIGVPPSLGCILGGGRRTHRGLPLRPGSLSISHLGMRVPLAIDSWTTPFVHHSSGIFSIAARAVGFRDTRSATAVQVIVLFSTRISPPPSASGARFQNPASSC